MRWPWQKKAAEKVDTQKPRVIVQGRSFAAAETDRLLSGWKWDNGFTASEIKDQLASLRAKSREMQKNSPHYKRLLTMVATNIVGEGFTFKSMPHDGPPWERRLDTQAAAFIEYHFWRWCNMRDPITGKTYADATGRKTMAEIDRMNAKTWARDGEYIMIVETADNPYGISLRVVRPDALDERFCEELQNGNTAECGIEKSRSTGEPVAYYFKVSDVKYATLSTTYGTNLIRIPASSVIHVFTPEDEGQPRGVPWGHAILRKLKMLDEYDTAELTAARDEACTVRSYETERGSEDAVIDLTDPNNSVIAGALVGEKEPGQSEVLPPGVKAKVNTPQHPNLSGAPFKAGMLKDVASGFGVEYANAFNDWAGVSFSSVRLGTITERDFWMMMQNDMITQDKGRVFLLWLRSFLSLSISGELPLEKYEKFSEHEFRGRRWMWVDPMRDMASAVIARDNGWKTDSQITADMGGDFDDNIAQIKSETEATKGTRLERTQTEPNTRAAKAARVVDAVTKAEAGNED